MLIGGQRDIRYLPINAYARLAGYNEHLQLEADILESYEIKEDRIFTFRLREGHRWSVAVNLLPKISLCLGGHVP